MLTKVFIYGQHEIIKGAIQFTKSMGLYLGGWLSNENYSLFEEYNKHKHVYFRKPVTDDYEEILIEHNISDSDGILLVTEGDSYEDLNLFEDLSAKYHVSIMSCNLNSYLPNEIAEISEWIKEKNIESLYIHVHNKIVFNPENRIQFFSKLKQIVKNEFEYKTTESKQIRKLSFRLNQTLAVLLLCIIFFGFKFFVLQIINHEEFSDKATKIQTSKREYKIRRADIVDRNGVVIGNSLDCVSIAVDPLRIRDYRLVSKILSDHLNINSVYLKNKMAQAGSDNKRYLLIKRGVSNEKANAIEGANIVGIQFFQDFLRVYPFRETAAPLVGFVGADGYGLEGIEYFYNSYLKSEKLLVNSLRTGTGEILKSDLYANFYKKRKKSLRLSIDICLTRSIDNKLFNCLDQNQNYLHIFGFVMDIGSGEILSISNLPSYDPNNYNNYDRKTYRNRCFTQLFYPGPILDHFINKSEITIQDSVAQSKIIYNGSNYSIFKQEVNKGTHTIKSRDELIHRAHILRKELEGFFGKTFKNIKSSQSLGVLPQTYVLKILLATSHSSIGSSIICTPLQFASFYVNEIFGIKLEPTLCPTNSGKISQIPREPALAQDDLIFLQSITSESQDDLFDFKFHPLKEDTNKLDLVVGHIELPHNKKILLCIGGLKRFSNTEEPEDKLIVENCFESYTKIL